MKTAFHIAFEVDMKLEKNIIMEPNLPSEGVIVVFIEVNGVS